MGAQDDIKPLVPLALSAIAELLDTDEDHLPAGLRGILENYGRSCHEKGRDSAYSEDTNPGRGQTNKGFPPPIEERPTTPPPPAFPDEETTRAVRPVRRTPAGAWTNDDDDQR